MTEAQKAAKEADRIAVKNQTDKENAAKMGISVPMLWALERLQEYKNHTRNNKA